ncbi:MAG: OmpA family protein [Cytophagales bacterium]|nr:OmpA family protein [Bernardetiaceae bacterium]MDW8210672.1 OmpA family protein [Cytophagales bacterium]
MKQNAHYVGLAIALGLFAGSAVHAQRQITNLITDRIYKADVQPKRERMPNIINTLLHDEYAPAISPDGRTLVYQSNRGGNSWQYYRLWEAKRDTVTGFWLEPQPIESINSKAGEGDIIGGPSLSYDGNTLYFFAKIGGGNEDIYMSQRGPDGKWGDPVPVPGAVNTGDYEGFPSISSDGQRLYFVRKGETTKNNTQCYKLMVSKRNLDGSWGTPEELPAPLNAGCEKHLRIMPDNQSVFFSTTRRGGSPKNSQDFDLYYSELQPGNTWSEPVPADIAPFVKNTMYSYQPDLLVSVAPNDDPHVLAYFTAYMGASYELFTTPVPDGMKPKRTCQFVGKVTDAATGEPLEATVKVDNQTRTSLSYVMKSQNGQIKTVLTEGNKYKITVELEDYEPIEQELDYTNGMNFCCCANFAMKRVGVKAIVAVIDGLTREPIEQGVVGIKPNDVSKGKVKDQKKIGPGKYEAILVPGTTYCAEGTADQYIPATITLDLTKKQPGDTLYREIFLFDLTKIAFDNINFATARPRNMTPKELAASLLPKSIEELNKVVKFMQDYPFVSISIEGHTDYRGSDSYNQGLSERRVAAAKQYLVSKGIAENRIQTKGFGETSPLVPNEVNGKPNDANMALNRRVEFKIIQKGSDGQRCN